MLKLIVYRDCTGKFRWRLKASNGCLIADSGESYDRPSGARRAAKSLMARMTGVVLVDQTAAK